MKARHKEKEPFTKKTFTAPAFRRTAAPLAAQTMTMEIGQFSIILRGSKASADHDDHDAAADATAPIYAAVLTEQGGTEEGNAQRSGAPR